MMTSKACVSRRGLITKPWLKLHINRLGRIKSIKSSSSKKRSPPKLKNPARHKTKAYFSSSVNNHKRLEEGDIVDFQDLLFTKERDYLVTYNGSEVKGQQLKGKVILLYVTSLSTSPSRCEIAMLADIYNQLKSSGRHGFEIVFVAYGDEPYLEDEAQDRFSQWFSLMPWLAIPFIDQAARERVAKRSGGQECCVFLHPSGKVPISELSQKVVGLFFFENFDLDRQYVDSFKAAYKELRDSGKDFEIVLINIHHLRDYHVSTDDDKASFWSTLRGMPWLALPFKDPTCWRLKRIFDYSQDEPWPPTTLVIIGPRGSFIEFYGADILERYGTEAYPFTRDKAAEIEVAEQKKLKLDSLLEPNQVLIRNDRSEVRLSELSGKRVLILFAGRLCFESNEFVKKLKKMYCKSKGKKDDEFEVIYIHLEEEEGSSSSSIQEVPWLLHPSVCEKQSRLFRTYRHVFKCCPSSGVVAFERDGMLLTKEDGVISRSLCSCAFPYIDDDLQKSTLKDLSVAYDWDYQYYNDTAYVDWLDG